MKKGVSRIIEALLAEIEFWMKLFLFIIKLLDYLYLKNILQAILFLGLMFQFKLVFNTKNFERTINLAIHYIFRQRLSGI